MFVRNEELELDMLNCLCVLYICMCVLYMCPQLLYGMYFVCEQLVQFSLHNLQNDKLSTNMNH